MAAPPSITTLDLSATWVMVRTVHFFPTSNTISYTINVSQNKALSDETDEILRLQGVSWFTRRAISLATITLYVRHYKDDDGIEHIDIDQKLTGIPGTSEYRILDWTLREHEDYLFGPVIGKSRRAKLDEIENEFLRDGWLPDTVESGVINSYVKSDTPKSSTSWIVEQVCQPFQHLVFSLVYKMPYLFRLGDSKTSMMKGVMFDMSTSSAPETSTFRPVLSMTSVSLFFNLHGRSPNDLQMLLLLKQSVFINVIS
jgi:hypothetical protein